LLLFFIQVFKQPQIYSGAPEIQKSNNWLMQSTNNILQPTTADTMQFSKSTSSRVFSSPMVYTCVWIVYNIVRLFLTARTSPICPFFNVPTIFICNKTKCVYSYIGNAIDLYNRPVVIYYYLIHLQRFINIIRASYRILI
jgi:hypothetical protein